MTGLWPEEFFERTQKVPLSKEPVRAIVASLLWPLKDVIVGESGSGTGGITLEIARRIESGHIYSCDPKKDSIDTVKKNLIKAQLENKVTLLEEGAPEAFKKMPLLNRLIIGGHGGDLSEILKTGAEKLLSNGRIIVTANMPETAVTAMKTLETIGMPPEMWHINVAKSRKIKDRWMMNSYNPTYIIWADKGEI